MPTAQPEAEPDKAGGIHTELSALPALANELRQTMAAEDYFEQMRDETVTVGYAYIDTDQESYVLSDGSVWTPPDQALDDQRQYAGIRFSFWKHLMPDEA